MTNLLRETLDDLAGMGKTPDDVRWVGSADGKLSVSWATFAEFAEDVNYDSGYGAQKIADDLVVVGDDWWMSRYEYDGSEWWQWHVRPELAAVTQPFEAWALKVTKNEVGWVHLGRERRQ